MKPYQNQVWGRLFSDSVRTWSAPDAGMGGGYPINGKQWEIQRYAGTRPVLPGQGVPEQGLPTKSGMSKTG